MPLNPTPNSLDALKQLLSTSGELDVNNPKGLYAGSHAADDRMDELKQHLRLQQENPHTYFASEKAPDALAHLEEDTSKGPNFGADAEATLKANNKATNDALMQGFTGDSEIAGPAADAVSGHPQNLYANVGDRSGLSPTARQTRSATAAAMYKEDAPTRAAVAGKLAESQGHINENREMYNLYKGDQQGAPATPPPSAPPMGAPAPAAAPAAPKSFLGKLKDFATGSGVNGPGSYNSLSDLLGAKGERTMAGFSATPETTAIQEALLGNAQSLAGIFPSSRAAGVLHKIAQDFQSNIGNETPAASYLKLHNQMGALDNAEREFDDPSYRFKINNGRLEPAATNQTIERAKLAVTQSRGTLQRAIHQMELLHPGIQSALTTGQPGAPQGAPGTPSRFTRLPEPQ